MPALRGRSVSTPIARPPARGGFEGRARGGGARAVAGWTVAALAVLFVTRHALLSSLRLRAAAAPAGETFALPAPSVLRVLGLGHTELGADLIAARANAGFGARAAAGDEAALARALAAAVDLDPRFHSLYLRGATLLVHRGPDLTIEALTAADALLEKGAREFPGDWELAFQLGFNLLFELPKRAPPDDPRVLGWRQRGVEWLRQAALLDGGPPWLAPLAAQMLTRRGGEALAIRQLEQSYAVTSDPETRAEIGRALGQLRERHRAADLAQAAAELERTVNERYPYAPEAFSLVAGPRVTPGIDLERLLRRESRPSP